MKLYSSSTSKKETQELVLYMLIMTYFMTSWVTVLESVRYG